jgi:cell division protein FtsI (penicillin-binding protein 3)
MVKPRFISEIRVMNNEVETFDTEVLNKKICSDKTLNEIRDILKNIVVRGTGSKLYSEYFSMAGKTGTARTEYAAEDWAENRRYISSFVGYFPAEHPKYSCIVVIHKPSTKKGYYGSDVTGPVFKRIAQKIFTDSPLIDTVEDINSNDIILAQDFENYYTIVQAEYTQVPDVVGMAGMDAVSILENSGLRVKLIGNGTVATQSINKGEAFKNGQQITLSLK